MYSPALGGSRLGTSETNPSAKYGKVDHSGGEPAVVNRIRVRAPRAAMSKTGDLKAIIDAFGPHLHDAPYDGWRADRVIDRVVPTHCPYCAVQCGMNLLVEKNHVVGFEPRYDFPVNEGRLCPKGVTAYLQVHHPDRLLHPLIKRNGNFERRSWDEALNLVVSKFKELQERHGKDSIGVYSGSSLTTEKTYLMGKFARAGLGTRYVDYNGRLCMVSAAAANNK